MVKPGGWSSYETSECQLVVVMLSSISKLKDCFPSLTRWVSIRPRNPLVCRIWLTYRLGGTRDIPWGGQM